MGGKDAAGVHQAEADESTAVATECACPRFSLYKGAAGSRLVNHTLACLRRRRGGRTLRQYYGVPATER